MNTKILPPTPENITRAAEALRRGEVVAMPTETVYGLAGVAFNPAALAKIFSVKERPTFDPLIVHFAAPAGQGSSDVDWVAYLSTAQLLNADALSDVAREHVQRLASQFWPGPLTLVVPKQPAVPDLATSGLPTVALRMPRHPVAQALLTAVAQPLAAPSANRFGRISPTSAEDVRAELAGRIAIILDGGRCTIGLESTVVSVAADGSLALLRPGGTPAEALAAAVGAPLHRATSTPTTAAQPAPGMLASHYAPSKPLRVLPVRLADLTTEQLQVAVAGHRGLGLLLQAGDPAAARERLAGLLPQANLTWEFASLSREGRQDEAAQNLFATLRQLDRSATVELILAEPVAEPTGLGHAIADRLARASA